MTDIVERLRARWDDPSQFDVDCKEAADEIERMRETLAGMVDFVERCRDAGCPSTSEELRMKRFLFEYRHRGAEWGAVIDADDEQDAIERMRAMQYANYKGEIAATIPIPGGNWLARLFGWRL